MSDGVDVDVSEADQHIAEMTDVSSESGSPVKKRGGRREGAGRKLGSKNKKNILADAFRRVVFDYEREMVNAIMSPDVSAEKRADLLIKLAKVHFNPPEQEVTTNKNEKREHIIRVESNIPVSGPSADRKKELANFLNVPFHVVDASVNDACQPTEKKMDEEG